MAFMSILLANIFLTFVLGSAFLALILLIISMVLFSKSKKAKTEGKTTIKKTGAVVTLVFSILMFMPLIATIFATSIGAMIQNEKKEQIIESFENKVYVKRDEWKQGFKYNDIDLVPIAIFINSDNYHSSGAFQNLDKIGALIIENTNSFYTLYELSNDSGYKIYYVWVESFSGGEYYSRTFVDKNDYDQVLAYYNTADLEASVVWRSAPQETGLSNIKKGLDLDIDDYSGELIELSQEILDDAADKMRVITSSDEYDNSMEFEIRSEDRVYTVDLVIYTKQDDIALYLNGYEAEDAIVQKHRDMLLYLVNESQKELLSKAEKAE